MSYVQGCSVKIINVDNILERVESSVSEDNSKFCLQNKSKLIKSFIVLRICNSIFNVIDKNKHQKLLFYTSKSAKLEEFKDYFNFFYSTFIRVAKILSLTYLYEKISIAEFEVIVNCCKGEGKEARIKVFKVFNRAKKHPNVEKLKAMLVKYNITSSSDIDNNFNMKLGLFIT
jgi:hypothetical protein